MSSAIANLGDDRPRYVVKKPHLTAYERSEVIAYANTHDTRAAALAYDVSMRSITRWRNGHTQKVW